MAQVQSWVQASKGQPDLVIGLRGGLLTWTLPRVLWISMIHGCIGFKDVSSGPACRWPLLPLAWPGRCFLRLKLEVRYHDATKPTSMDLVTVVFERVYQGIRDVLAAQGWRCYSKFRPSSGVWGPCEGKGMLMPKGGDGKRGFKSLVWSLKIEVQFRCTHLGCLANWNRVVNKFVSETETHWCWDGHQQGSRPQLSEVAYEEHRQWFPSQQANSSNSSKWAVEGVFANKGSMCLAFLSQW